MLRSLTKKNFRELFLSLNSIKIIHTRKILYNHIINIPILGNPSTSINSLRFLSKKSNSKKNKKFIDEEEKDEEYEDLEEDDDEDFISSIDTSKFRTGFKITQKHVPSLRVDSMLASGLSISRKKIDESFYSGKLRLNGEKVLKKSHSVKENDRIDLIGDIDEKIGKRTLKRVFLYKVFDETSKKNKPKVVIVTWKAGLFEEDAFKNIYY